MMKRAKILSLILLVTLSITVLWLVRSVSTREKTNAPADVVINFDTLQVTERVWYGTASGGTSGQVTIEALNDPPQVFRGTWAGRTRWQIVAGSDSFVAEMDGKINTFNGVLVMRGRVINGANTTAEILAQGQVVSINPHHFVGAIRISQP